MRVPTRASRELCTELHSHRRMRQRPVFCFKISRPTHGRTTGDQVLVDEARSMCPAHPMDLRHQKSVSVPTPCTSIA